MKTMITKAEARVRVAANVKRIRVQRGITQVELAALAQIEQPTISRLERGHVLPNAADLANLAEALDSTTEALMRPVPEAALGDSSKNTD
jgi:transcriptional regulator with XRE-family HTH domain